jgi:UDP-MurNAc hydroxylase
MKLQFFGNAFVQIITADNKHIVCDPWIYDGAYYGSWHHYPPLDLPKSLIEDVDYIYISHLHPDHLDKKSLLEFDPTTPLLVSERPTPILPKTLESLGFSDIRVLPVGIEHKIDNFSVRLWNDFKGDNVSRKDKIDFSLDSSIAILQDGRTIINFNDNIIEPEEARNIKRLYPSIDLVLLPYAGGGAYPQLFDNLTADEKVRARKDVQLRFLNNFLDAAKVLSAKATIPCAGEYIIGGKNWDCTEYIHTPTPRDIVDAWSTAQIDSKLEIMGCSDIYDLTTCKTTRNSENSLFYSHADRIEYAKTKQASPYIIDEFKIPAGLRLSRQALLHSINKAAATLERAQKRFNSYPRLSVLLDVPEAGLFQKDMSEEHVGFHFADQEPSTPYLKIVISYEYLFALFTQHIHWNNLEIGNHIKMFRSPESYQPDIHLLLSFLHF